VRPWGGEETSYADMTVHMPYTHPDEQRRHQSCGPASVHVQVTPEAISLSSLSTVIGARFFLAHVGHCEGPWWCEYQVHTRLALPEAAKELLALYQPQEP
jgi:hypothetical protein